MLSRYSGAAGGTGDIESENYQRPDNGMVARYSGAGPTDNIESAISEYQKVMAPKNAHPLENYLGGVSDQESYRPAMMQYMANGGKRPQWFTGNYETDQPNIEAAISATMTPEQQMKRQEIQTRNEELETARTSRIAIQKQSQLDKERDSAAKQEGLKQKAQNVTREDKLTAHNVMAGVLGADYKTTDKDMLDAISARVASGAKVLMSSEEGKGLGLEEAMQKQVDKMVLKGELALPSAATGAPVLNRIGSALHGVGLDWLGGKADNYIGHPAEKMEFNRPEPTDISPVQVAAPSQANDWVRRAQADPRNKGVSLETIITNGKRLGKIP